MSKKKPLPIVVVDVETSGLVPGYHNLLEIGVLKLDADHRVAGTFNSRIAPIRPGEEFMDPTALRINGYTPEAWEGAKSLREVLSSLLIFLGPGQVEAMGWNVGFDLDHINAAFKDVRLPSPFHYRKRDLGPIAWFLVGASGSLSHTAELLGLEAEPPVHRAINGAVSSYAVYRELVGLRDHRRVDHNREWVQDFLSLGDME